MKEQSKNINIFIALLTVAILLLVIPAVFVIIFYWLM